MIFNLFFLFLFDGQEGTKELRKHHTQRCNQAWERKIKLLQQRVSPKQKVDKAGIRLAAPVLPGPSSSP